ncbi:S-layer homology domain-containing protein [Bacillus sp. 31A1R]|uniref:S-layer homology domain-containing protein n=1 Tax=Robertmurraya mangrovi TaxID=3098077 RepID=A0ABU5J0Z4_9BACI|nr:S-layer homology domain-containing protein [Bacillus sp. 31A1R]MDZ5473090.1 S-layer homology domain-containing protein [Bacillus sp. 31A1R]
MKNLKKFGVLSLSTALSLSILAPVTSASTIGNEHSNQIQIRLASTESTVSKNELIKKFKEFFPNQFDFLTSNDFHMNSGHRFPEDDTVRYELSFHKTVQGKQIYGSVGFVGEKLEIENFYYDPVKTASALFPAKIKQDEAKKIASEFIKRFPGGKEYEIEDYSFQHYRNQTLTEPVRYSFSFVQTKDKVLIPDQRIEVAVLGSGEIVNFYRSAKDTKSFTFDDKGKMKTEKELLEQVKKSLSVNLQYQLDYDYSSGDRKVKLVYKPTEQFTGVNAITGEWRTANGFTKELPPKKKIDLLATSPLPAKHSDFNVDKAKALAEQLLAVNSDKIKLRIESVEERENHLGKKVISIQYMYEYQNGGHGTTLEFDSQTGEIIQYHDIRSEVLSQYGEKTNQSGNVTREQALNKAVKYMKEYAPSYLHHYSKPIDDYVFEDRGNYHFSFPRVVNGISVAGDQISVVVSAEGSLISLNVGYQEVESWPSIKDTITEDKAKAQFLEALSLKLHYVLPANSKQKHYHLVYSPEFKNKPYNMLEAHIGDWTNLNDLDNSPRITHPSAEEELNYLLDAKILKVKDVNKFNANASVTKGEALEIMVKSLTYFYEGYPPGREETKQTFSNIDPKHPLYQVIERAVSLGILDTTTKTFDFDKKITREELAAWYVRAMGLEEAAKHSNIYKLTFEDSKKVSKKYYGHVALATSVGLLKTDKNKFNPDKNVSYAHLADSIFRLAHKVYENGNRMNY